MGQSNPAAGLERCHERWLRFSLSMCAVLPWTMISTPMRFHRETTVVWDRGTGEPLHNAIVWHDMRMQHLVDRNTHKLGIVVRTNLRTLPV